MLGFEEKCGQEFKERDAATYAWWKSTQLLNEVRAKMFEDGHHTTWANLEAPQNEEEIEELFIELGYTVQWTKSSLDFLASDLPSKLLLTKIHHGNESIRGCINSPLRDEED